MSKSQSYLRYELDKSFTNSELSMESGLVILKGRFFSKEDMKTLFSICTTMDFIFSVQPHEGQIKITFHEI